MATDLFLVFSRPPAGLDDREYNRWYGNHLFEILATPGFLAARRYAMAGHRGDGLPAGFPYLSLYETTGETEELRRDLAAERPNMRLPEWFEDIEFASWVGTAVGDEGGFATPDHLYMNFSHEPDRMSFEAYTDWYRDHQQQNIAQTDHLRRGWRYHLDPNRAASPDATESEDGPTHLALYEMDGTLEDMNADLGQAMRAGTIELPDWFRRTASLEATAIGERVSQPMSADTRKEPTC